MTATSLVQAALDKALRHAPNDIDLLSLKGSLGDTLSPEEVLRYLKDWNATGRVIHERCGHCPYASPTGCDGWCLEES